MPRFTQHCTACAWADTIVAAPFENPPCPQCGGVTERLWVGTSAPVVTDEAYIGGITLENYGKDPVTFYSRAERRRYMTEHGLEDVACHRPPPGSDRSTQGLVRWDALMDPYTLAQARILLERVAQAPPTTDPPVRVESFQFTVKDGTGTFAVKGEAS